MNYSFDGQAYYKYSDLSDYKMQVLISMSNNEYDKETLEKVILVSIFESFQEYNWIMSSSFSEGETLTCYLSFAKNLKIVCTKEDLVIVNNRLIGFNDKFAKDFNVMLDEIVAIHDVEEIIRSSVRIC